MTFFSTGRSGFAGTGQEGGGGGAERNGLRMLYTRDATSLAEEVTGSKRPDIIGPGQLALGWWGTMGGRDGDWE